MFISLSHKRSLRARMVAQWLSSRTPLRQPGVHGFRSYIQTQHCSSSHIVAASHIKQKKTGTDVSSATIFLKKKKNSKVGSTQQLFNHEGPKFLLSCHHPYLLICGLRCCLHFKHHIHIPVNRKEKGQKIAIWPYLATSYGKWAIHCRWPWTQIKIKGCYYHRQLQTLRWAISNVCLPLQALLHYSSFCPSLHASLYQQRPER